MKEILKLTPEEGRRIVWDDTEEFEMINEYIINNNRWSIHYGIIVQRLSDNKFFKSIYSVGLLNYKMNNLMNMIQKQYLKKLFQLRKL